MKRYKVVALHVKTLARRDSPYALYAQELREKFGLEPYYSLEEVIRIWEQYSDDYSAGWLFPDKQGVESAFGVTLEESHD